MSDNNIKSVFESAVVYVAQYPFPTASDYVSSARAKEISACGNERARKCKYYVWKLLEYAFDDLLGMDLNAVDISRNANGKLTCGVAEFSVTHSGNVVAAAIFDRRIGVDLERRNTARFDGRILDKILTASERESLMKLPQGDRALYANCLWTVKEAVFKRDGGKTFIPNTIECKSERFETASVFALGDEYILSVSSVGDFDIEYRYVNVDSGNSFKLGEILNEERCRSKKY
ncbi:MAG: 4'-phosphopantetheinyl transferase superfamily protein [Firmicutes bacterium]|nr:4'-phosphopantetheinyl transferase superfamily protein [Bacillota bacterium]